jgi:hypothetical protein
MGQLFALMVRHALTAIGLNELLDESQTQQLIGALAVVAGIAWSIAQKPALRAKLARLVGLGVVILPLLWLGCASAPVKITYSPGVAGEAGVIGGGEAARAQLSTVEVDPSAYGRQCFDLAIDPDGTVGVTYAVDASSDYAGVRVLPSILPEIVGAVMAAVGAPFDLIGSLLGVPRPELPAPSAISACSAIFED